MNVNKKLQIVRCRGDPSLTLTVIPDPTNGFAHSNLQTPWRVEVISSRSTASASVCVSRLPCLVASADSLLTEPFAHAGLDPQDSFAAAEKSISLFAGGWGGWSKWKESPLRTSGNSFLATFLF